MMTRSYFLKRLLFIPITLFGIMAINFVIVQLVPGGPVEQMMIRLKNPQQADATARFSGSGNSFETVSTDSSYRQTHAVDQEIRRELEKRFGFDQPPLTRFFQMIKNYLLFDFGNSFYRDQSVMSLVLEKMPVSVSLGVFSTLLIYLISIPLGIKKALKQGSVFDITTSWVLTISYAVPAFLFALFFIIFFAGGQYLNWFPLKGLVSDNFETLSLFGKIKDYLWHITLPVLSLSLGSFAGLTMLTKNAFLDEISKNYCKTAKAKGLAPKQILYGHVFRNAMLIVIAGFPALLIGMLFTGSVLIEVIFSLDGIGLLGFEAVQNRDYPVVFGTLYLFALLGLVLNLLSDFIYTLVDPRITFERRLE